MNDVGATLFQSGLALRKFGAFVLLKKASL